MKSYSPNKKILGTLLAAIVILVFCGLFYLIWYRPAAAESVALMNESEEKLKFLQATEEIVRTKREEAKNAEKNKTIHKSVPDSPGQDQILRDIETAQQASGAMVVQVTFNADDKGEGMNSGNTSAEGLDDSSAESLNQTISGLMGSANLMAFDMSLMTFQIQMNASLPQLKRFASSIQQDERLYVVRSLNFGNKSDNQGTMAILSISAFFQASGHK